MPSYEGPTPDAHEYEFQLNAPSPSEVPTNFEVSRAAVREVAGYVNELENAKLIAGARMFIFGGSVAEPARIPSDIDVFLIYDHIERPYEGRGLWAGKGNNPISEKALDIYQKISSTDTNLKLVIGDPKSSAETTYPHHINLVTMSRREFLTTLEQDQQRNRVDFLDAIENIAYLIPYVPTPAGLEIIDLANLMPPFANSWEEIQGERDGKEIQAYLNDSPRVIQSVWIKERLAGLIDLPPREVLEKAKLLLRDIVLRVDETLQEERSKQADDGAKRKIYEASKMLRSSFQSYIDGRNFVQTAIGNGAVLIKGENLLDQNRQPVFTMVDKEFLK